MIFLIFCILTLASAATLPKVLIVFAHQESQSFCFAMRNRMIQALTSKGHEVRLSNLYQMKMFGALDKTDFTELVNNTYFHPQQEQLEANHKGRATFSEELRREHDKVEWADIILFVHPYYIMYIPGIMKSWMERVFSCGFAYCDKYVLEGKKVMMVYSAGAPKEYIKELEQNFRDSINNVFRFTKMIPLEPWTAYAVKNIEHKDRVKYLADLEQVMYNIEKREPYKFSVEPSDYIAQWGEH